MKILSYTESSTAGDRFHITYKQAPLPQMALNGLPSILDSKRVHEACGGGGDEERIAPAAPFLAACSPKRGRPCGTRIHKVLLQILNLVQEMGLVVLTYTVEIDGITIRKQHAPF